MPKSLVVVESPAKAKTIKKILGTDFIVDSSVGHIRDLPKKELGVDVENNFKPKYVLIHGKGKVVKNIQEKAKEVDCIYLAADPDREGEAICWHLANELKKSKKPIYRIVYNEVTQSAILEAIQNPGTIDQALVDAQQARRVLDRLIGYKIGPILWSSVRKPGLSAGRVQSVAVRLICEREEEIEAFNPEEYWSLTATLSPQPKEHLFPAKLQKIAAKKGEINNYGFRIDETEAKNLAKDAKQQTYTVEKVQKRERKQKPVPPFITSTLQQEAARKLRFTAKRTMMVAQKLYEGLEIGKEGLVGLITYMRTDSTRVANDALTEIRNFIKSNYGADYLPGRVVNYPSKRGTQDAHEAIRPTLPLRTPDSIKSHLTTEQFQLYDLIWKRLIASQMNPAILDATTIDIKAGKFSFRATGSVIKFDGFRRIYMEGKDDVSTDDENGKENITLPEVKEGETLDLRKLDPKQHFTQPPPRYNEATLVKALEAKEIGRPSTYATILSTIQDRGYVTNEQRRLHPTDVGKLVNALLIQGFPDILDVEFTREMEQKLDTIAEGKAAWNDTLSEFYPPFQDALNEAPDKMYEARKAMETESDVECEKCGGKMIVKWGRYGRFLGCANYPECKTIKALNGDDTAAEEPEVTDTLCDKCGEPMVIKQSRAGARFLACSGYPKCKNAKPIPMGVDCPEEDCDGYLGERRSRRGKVFYGCSNYPKCGFASWDKPIPEPCPECDASYIVEKAQKTGEMIRSCAADNCDYTQAVS